MSNETVASWVWCGSRLTTIRTVFDPVVAPAASPSGVETSVDASAETTVEASAETSGETGTDTDFEYAITASLSVWWKCTERSCRSAGWRRRNSFSVVMSGAMVRPSRSADSQSRGRSWYFSESR